MPARADEHSRRSVLRVWVPVVLSALVQAVSTAWALRLVRPPAGAHFYGPAGAAVAMSEPHFGRPPYVVFSHWAIAVAFVIALVGPGLLTLVRRAPRLTVVVITVICLVGGSFFLVGTTDAPFYLSVYFAAGIASLHDERIWAWCCVGAAWLFYITIAVLSGPGPSTFWLVPLTLISVATVVVPEIIRNRRARHEQALHDAEARRVEEAQAERVRIARELHDVLAHSLSQINVQASVGLHLFDTQPDKAAEALANVKDTSKRALGEVRQVLGMLRGDAPLAPEQGLAGLGALVDELAAHGVAGALRLGPGVDVTGVPAAVQQAVYRIVQEALTNVTKHAGAHRVTVEVQRDGAHLSLRIVDDGVGAAASASPDGRGLLGMRERAELLGGTFAAGARSGGGFEVAAELPMAGLA